MTPFFSVVVAARDVRAYVGDSVGSVLAQDMADFELIVVDDASTDGTAEMLLDYDDVRMHVLLQPESLGPGPTRNVGIAVATGDYVVFLDSDDVMTAGSLRAIRERIEQTQHPDVLVYDYARLYWDGRQERNMLGDRIVAAAQAGVFDLSARPELLGIFNAPWSRAYRLDFVRRWDLTFPPGYYEDLPWTMGSLMMATRIAALDRIVVLYRQRLDGSILRSRDHRHLDVFDQWEATFALLAGHPEWERYRGELFHFMINQFDAMLVAHGRIPDDARRDFFHLATRSVARHRPTDWRPALHGVDALRGTNVRLKALADGNYAIFTAVAANKPRVDQAKKIARGALPSLRARVSRHVPDRPDRGYRATRRDRGGAQLAVFSSYWHRRPACNPLAISAELARRAPQIEQVWVTQERMGHAVPPYATWVSPHSKEYGQSLARAGLLVNNVNYPDWMHRRPDQVYLQTQHGTPLKTMGLDMMHRPGARTGFDSWPALIERIGQWSHCLSSNRYSTLVWERSMPGPYQMWEVGYPRNDILVTGDPQRTASVRRSLGIDGRVAVLYVPTIRDYGAVPGTSLDIDAFASRLPDSHVLLVRDHYLQIRASSEIPGVQDVTDYHPIEDLLLASDVLVTDYSSTMFDFANTGKPIIHYCPDWDAFRIVRGTYFDLSQENAGAFCRTEGELLDLLVDPRALAQLSAARAYADFRERFCQFEDGRATQAVVERLLGVLHRES